jgi:hypothetical protein
MHQAQGNHEVKHSSSIRQRAPADLDTCRTSTDNHEIQEVDVANPYHS